MTICSWRRVTCPAIRGPAETCVGVHQTGSISRRRERSASPNLPGSLRATTSPSHYTWALQSMSNLPSYSLDVIVIFHDSEHPASRHERDHHDPRTTDTPDCRNIPQFVVVAANAPTAEQTQTKSMRVKRRRPDDLPEKITKTGTQTNNAPTVPTALFRSGSSTRSLTERSARTNVAIGRKQSNAYPDNDVRTTDARRSSHQSCQPNGRLYPTPNPAIVESNPIWFPPENSVQAYPRRIF